MIFAKTKVVFFVPKIDRLNNIQKRFSTKLIFVSGFGQTFYNSYLIDVWFMPKLCITISLCLHIYSYPKIATSFLLSTLYVTSRNLQLPVKQVTSICDFAIKL